MDGDYNPSGKGPIKNRSCTDVICLVLFIIFFVAFIVVGVWAFNIGDINQLLYPKDSEGNYCGVDKFSDRPYLFYFDITRCSRISYSLLYGCPTPTVCIDQCPTEPYSVLHAVSGVNVEFNVADAKEKFICKYHVDISGSNSIDSLIALIRREDCAAYYLPSQPVVNRCFPKIPENIIDLLRDANNNTVELFDASNKTVNETDVKKGLRHLEELVNLQQFGMNLVEDLARSWTIILIFFGLAVVLCYLTIIIMRWVAGPMVLICIILFIGVFICAVYYCFDQYFTMKAENPNEGNLQFRLDPQYYIQHYQTWLVLGIIAAVILVISLLIVLVLRKRLLIAIALIKESSRAIGSMMFTLVWPIVPLLLHLVVFAYFLFSMAFLATTGRDKYYRNDTGILSEIPCDPRENSTAGNICSFVHYGGNKEYSIVLQLFQLFMWLWVMNFLIGFSQLTLAGAFASYYWAFNKRKDLPLFPVASSVARSARYHIGSVAFGSLLIAICQMIRIILEFLDRRLKGAENRIARCLVRCLKCCFWCLEKFIKFINRNAYIMIAVAGKNFCVSAKNAFSLILRNILRAAVLDGVTDFLLFLCKLFVVGGIGVLSFYFFSGELSRVTPSSQFSVWLRMFEPKLHYYFIPVAIIVISTFFIASLFFSVYNMAVDTLFLCFLEDLERNDGSVEKPYFMNKELLEILGKRNERYREIKANVKSAGKKGKRSKNSTDATGF